MKNGIRIIVIGLFLLLSSSILIKPSYGNVPIQATYYVSPNGSDSNPGTLSAPFKTIQQARDVVRTINHEMTGDILVYLRGGTYSLSNTIELNELDSGSNGYKVIYKAYPTELPVLTGGVPVTGWTLDSGGIYKATVSSVSNFRQLYVNGDRAQRARSSGVSTALAYHYDEASKINGFIVSDSVVGFYDNPDHVELNWTREWVNTRLPVDQVIAGESGQKVVLMQQPYFDWAMTMNAVFNSIAVTDPFYIENAKELLDEAGEWYFNQTTSTLYYWPKPGENMESAEVYVPKETVETLLSIEGSSITSQAQDIEIQGLTFMHTTSLRASTQGVAPLQASFWANEVDQTAFTTNGVIPPAAIVVEHANQIVLDSNTLKHLGAAGIKMANDVQNSEITNNNITDTSADAVIIGTWLHRHIDTALQEGLCTNILVRNNVISHVSNEYWSSPAITVFFGKQIDVQHNDISHIPYTGISMGWDGWGGVMWDEFTLGSNRIAWNKISDYIKKMRDGGGIYTLNTQPDTVIEGNYISNMNHSYGGIYPDEGSGYIKVMNNVIENMGTANWLYIWHPSINHITVDNNYTNSTNLINNGTKSSISNTNYYAGTRPAAAQAIVNHAGVTADAYVPLAAPPEPALGDLAYQKPCYAFYMDDSYATVHPGSDACRAVDGYASTYAQAFGQWKWKELINLGSVKNVNKVVVTFPQVPIADVTLYASEYNVKVSIDGTNYTTAAVISGASGGIVTTTFKPVSARYVMIEAVKPDNSGQAGIQLGISNLEIFGTVDNPEFNVPVNDNVSDIKYTGSWVYSTDRGYGNYLDDVHYTNRINDYFEFTFTGTGIDLISEKYFDRGDMDIYIDGSFIETVSCYSPGSMVQQTVFSSGELPNGLHTIKGVMKSGSAMVIDSLKVYDQGFNPPAKSNLKLWLRADAGVAKDTSGYVGTWEDLSGTGNHAVQTNTTNKPLWVDNVINGKPVIRFDGVNDFLSIPGLTGAMNDFTVIFMLRPASLNNYNQKLLATGAWGQFVMHADANGGLYAGTDIATRIEPSTSTYKRGNYSKDVFQRWAYTYSSVSGKGSIYIDDYNVPEPKTQTAPNNWSGFELGENGSGTIHGDVTEVFIYDKALTDAERIHIISYLNTKYVNN